MNRMTTKAARESERFNWRPLFRFAGRAVTSIVRSMGQLSTLKLLGVLLVLKVVVAVILSYPDYFPPDFKSDFLRGRESSFRGSYRIAFAAHVLAGPPSLVMGLWLLSDGARRKRPDLHRVIGRIYVVVVLLVLAPSGLRMSWEAQGGTVAGIGFATLAAATGYSAWLGWRTAVARRFDAHRRWMGRLYVLLLSAVVLRAFGGLTEFVGIESAWPYQMSAWMSWIGPLVVWEGISRWDQVRPLPRS